MPDQLSQSSKDIRQDLVRYATNVLSRRPYLSGQLKDKLTLRCVQKGFENSDSIVDEIIADIKSAGFLNDEYLVESLIKRHLSKGYGPRIISYKLKRLVRDDSRIGEILQKLDEEGYVLESAIKFVHKKRLQNDRKGFFQLSQRGYSSKTIKLIFDAESFEY